MIGFNLKINLCINNIKKNKIYFFHVVNKYYKILNKYNLFTIIYIFKKFFNIKLRDKILMI